MVADERLQAPLAHWAAHSQQSPADPGTGAGALMMAGGHGSPGGAAGRRLAGDGRRAGPLPGGGRGAAALRRAGDRVEMAGERAVAVHAGGERLAATRAVVSALDARRLLLELVDAGAVPPWLVDEVRRIHVGRRNVSELKIDAILAGMPPPTGPSGFERSFMLSANTHRDLERAFARIQLGELPERPPLMIAFPSALEHGWAPPGRAALWLSTFVPWRAGRRPLGPARPGARRRPRLAGGRKALGIALEPVERRLTGPPDWVARTATPTPTRTTWR